MTEKRISVKELVGFIFASGDLESQTKMKRAENIGQRLHTERQATYGAGDQKEVFVEDIFIEGETSLHISGRIDGLLMRDNTLIVEEIKSTQTALEMIDAKTYPQHLMQAILYSYMVAKEKSLSSITIWLTYIHQEHETVKTIKQVWSFEALKEEVIKTLDAYSKWLKITEEHHALKRKSLEGLSFPFEELREGQHPFMAAVYQTMLKKDILYATAPTGIGKTVAGLFSALKTIKNDKEKVFYLTAKNAGKTVAVETVELLKEKGLKAKAITLNSKEVMCLQEEVDCDPDLCPYARGFYERLKKGLEDIFVHEDVYDSHLIKQYAEFHTLCPHEFALEISNYSDIIICDYNYVFDPRVKLIRYFEDDYYEPKLLIDEAHNLVDRSKAMYSASLSLAELHAIKASLHGIKPSPMRAVNTLIKAMETFVSDKEVEKSRFYVSESIDDTLIHHVHYLAMKLDELLVMHKKHPKRKAIREAYFLLNQFMRISEFFTDSFRYTVEASHDTFSFNIVCFDASVHIKELIELRAEGTVFFSATLTPVDYYAALLTQGEGKYLEVPSPFNPRNLGLFVDVSTSTKYKDRTMSVTRIIDTLYAMLEAKKGNYIVFFPSYLYLEMVLEVFEGKDYTVLTQTRDMSHSDRDKFLETFKAPSENSKIMFSVLGGSFSEGIDYIGDLLHGVLIVGVALPVFSPLNQLLRDYYYEKGYEGYHYAYTYPGMNKVIQAVGRVIRKDSDKGIAILLDTRYQLPTYKTLFPRHWYHAKTVVESDVMIDYLQTFWDKD